MKKSGILLIFLFVFSLTSVHAFDFTETTSFNFPTNNLGDLGDVNIINGLDQQVILLNATNGEWYNAYLNDSAHHVNASDYLITNIGSIGNMNSTQFSNNGGYLNIIESWVDSLWCRLTGCTMEGDLNMGDNDIINVNAIIGDTLTASTYAGGGFGANQIIHSDGTDLIGNDNLFYDGTNFKITTFNAAETTIGFGQSAELAAESVAGYTYSISRYRGDLDNKLDVLAGNVILEYKGFAQHPKSGGGSAFSQMGRFSLIMTESSTTPKAKWIFMSDEIELTASDSVEINGAVVITDNATIDRLALGTNSLSGLSSGDSNHSTIYYDTLSAKSPIVFELGDGLILTKVKGGDWIECNPLIKESCPIESENKMNRVYGDRQKEVDWQFQKGLCVSETHSYSSLRDYKNGDENCFEDIEKLIRNCNGEFESFNETILICEFDEVGECESVAWQIWREDKCYNIPQLECRGSRENNLKYWDGDSCEVDLSKVCLSDINKNWNSMTSKCYDDFERGCRTQRGKYWDGDSCEFMAMEVALLER